MKKPPEKWRARRKDAELPFEVKLQQVIKLQWLAYGIQKGRRKPKGLRPLKMTEEEYLVDKPESASPPIV